jgi:hypothetical protein
MSESDDFIARVRSFQACAVSTFLQWCALTVRGAFCRTSAPAICVRIRLLHHVLRREIALSPPSARPPIAPDVILVHTHRGLSGNRLKIQQARHEYGCATHQWSRLHTQLCSPGPRCAQLACVLQSFSMRLHGAVGAQAVAPQPVVVAVASNPAAHSHLRVE